MTPRPLATKIARVLAGVSRVPKNGRNDFHRYDYVTESDLVDAIRGLLAEQGIAYFPSVAEHTTAESTERGKTATLATVTLEITLIDGESGDSMTTRWVGQGVDSLDKAYYKAYTGALKYFLLKTFLISTGDDPEGAQAPPAPRPPSRVTKLSDLTAAILERDPRGAVKDRWEAGILKRMKASSLAELTSDQLDYIIGKLDEHLASAKAALEAEA